MSGLATQLSGRDTGHMNRPPYPTDLSDDQWATLAPLLPAAAWWARPPTVDLREVCNAIMYVTRNGIPWKALPHDFPPRSTVYYYFRQWKIGRASCRERV